MNVVEPGTRYGDRLNQIDLRFSKLFNLGTGRLDLNVDLYNAFNSDAILTQQNAYGATWQNALTVIQPRFVKFRRAGTSNQLRTSTSNFQRQHPNSHLTWELDVGGWAVHATSRPRTSSISACRFLDYLHRR